MQSPATNNRAGTLLYSDVVTTYGDRATIDSTLTSDFAVAGSVMSVF